MMDIMLVHYKIIFKAIIIIIIINSLFVQQAYEIQRTILSLLDLEHTFMQ